VNRERDELRGLVSAFKRSLEAQVRAGGYAVPASASPRPEVDVEQSLEAEPSFEQVTEPVSAAAPEQAPAALVDEPSAVERPRTLQMVREELGDCTRCALHEGRNQIVFGDGSERADLMFVGEAPGAEEDRTGIPFVGRAGELLDKMVVAMGWSRSEVYIANVLKCRPPQNRDPRPEEVEACEAFLARQIQVIRPRIIVTLGKPAAHLLLRSTAPISALRGRWQEYMGIRLMPTFHPAYLLRNPAKKRETWADLQAVMAELERLGIAPR
jgi:DNA polymerase